MTKPRTVLLAGLLAVPFVLVFAGRADALYKFFLRKDLARALDEDPDALVGDGVVVTDELVRIWPEAPERPARLDGERYVLFDTVHFRCAIPRRSMGTHLEAIWKDAQEGYGQTLEDIEAINDRVHARELSAAEAAEQRRQLVWDLYRVYKNRPIVTLFGEVARADLWGDVAPNAARAGVGTEQITIVVDRAEKPRERWYRSGLDAE